MKDIAITLPEKLWYFICSGRKKIELRKCIPIKFDPFINRCWVMEKGTTRVLGFFFIESFHKDWNFRERIDEIANDAAVSVKFVETYYQGNRKAYIWKIGPVYQSSKPIDSFVEFGMRTNPQSFVYVDEPKHKLRFIRVQ